MERWSSEEKLIYPIVCTILTEIFKVENFAHGNAYGWDYHPVPRLIGFLRFVWAHFAPPCVRADRCNIIFLDPMRSLKRQTWRIATRISCPIPRRETALLMSRAHNHKVTFAYVDTLRSRTFIKIIVGDRIATPNHLIAHIFDSKIFGTIYRNIRRWKSIVHLVIKEDVAQGVPLRTALTR